MKTKAYALSLCLLATFSLPGSAQSASLTINGNTVAADFHTIGGQTYVSLADVAKALGMTITKTANGYQIAPAGGANQVGKLQGTVGDTIFDGKWRFQVLGVQKADQYVTHLNSFSETYSPATPSNTLIIVDCRLKNGQIKADEPMLSSIHPANTALADDQGQSYPPIAFDKHGATSDSNDFGANVLPGAASEFYIVFDVPKSANITSLVFIAGDDLSNGKDMRVMLAP
jgi:hypothetical protein